MTTPDNHADQPQEPKNGLDQRPAKPIGMSKKQQELMHSRLLAANFGNMVTVLMQSQHHKDIPLSELYGRLVAPLTANQFRVAEVAKEGSGMTVPVALIIWARVSDDVHARLQQNLDRPITLKGDEWTSGDNVWIVDVAGAERFIAPLLTGLRKSEFKNQNVYYRKRTEDGAKLETLDCSELGPPSAPTAATNGSAEANPSAAPA